ncbi:hypothetical protein JCM19046_3087 [Bacillus sp. JCM 19046]|nr:hypothetical protein JCM19046_3087 [Bacillus sp. JCM 19046]
MLNLIFLDAVSQISFIYDSFLWHLYGGYIPVSIVALFILMVISLLSKKEKRVAPVLAGLLLLIILVLFLFLRISELISQ